MISKLPDPLRSPVHEVEAWIREQPGAAAQLRDYDARAAVKAGDWNAATRRASAVRNIAERTMRRG